MTDDGIADESPMSSRDRGGPEETSMSQDPPCIFCRLAEQRDTHVYDNEGAFAIRDIHPVAHGHTLIISRRHVPTAFDLEEAEVLAFARALRDVRDELAKKYRTDAFNIVINSGPEAGQSVFHAHAHLIPRTSGDAASGLASLGSVISSR